MQLTALQCRTPHHEITARAVSSFAGDLRYEDEAQQLGTAGHHAPRKSPVANATAFNVPAGDDQVGATPYGTPQFGEGLRRMLQIGVHYGKNIAAGDLPSAQNRGGQVAPLLAANGPDLRKFMRQSKRFFPSAIGTVVVHDDNFVPECGNAIQDGNQFLDEWVDMRALVIGREN